MVEQCEVDRLGSEGESAGEVAVVGARGRIAARVVMRQDDARAAVHRGIPDHIAEGKGGTANVAIVAGEVDAPRLVVDMGDPQMFFVGASFRKASGEETPGRLEPVQLQR